MTKAAAHGSYPPPLLKHIMHMPACRVLDTRRGPGGEMQCGLLRNFSKAHCRTTVGLTAQDPCASNTNGIDQ